jgi:RNA polymerase sigma-70 factor (ECF subfamily)
MAVPIENQQDSVMYQDDSSLVQAALKDPIAFGTLYERYCDRIYRYTLVCSGNAEDAADLTQQIFLRALDALHQYRLERGSFQAWLLRIAHNVAINFVKRHRSTSAWDFTMELTQPGLGDPEVAFLRQESFDYLRSLLEHLDQNKREMLVLRFVSGLSIAEIASIVGKSEAATRKQLTRILHTLKEQYHDIAQ